MSTSENEKMFINQEFDKFRQLPPSSPYTGVGDGEAKECALISLENEYNAKIQAYNEMAEFCPDVAMQAVVYTRREKEQVKQEIQKL